MIRAVTSKRDSDGAAGKPFSPLPAPAPSRRQTNGLIPKFSENPFGWLLAVLIVVELWVLWQLIKAPFQLVGSLMEGKKPSASVIVKNAILAGLALVLVWSLANAKREGPSVAGAQSATSSTPRTTIDEHPVIAWTRTSSLLETFGPPPDEYGIPFGQMIQRRPDILAQLQRLKPGIDASAFGDSGGALVATLDDGRQFVAIWGCPLHMCVGQHSAAAIDMSTNTAYLIDGNYPGADPSERRITFYGLNDAKVRSLLNYLEQHGTELDSQYKTPR